MPVGGQDARKNANRSSTAYVSNIIDDSGLSQESRMKERMAAYIADTVGAMLAYWDDRLVCRFANKSYRDWFGVSKDDMVNKMTLPELLGQDLFEKNRPFVMAALHGETQTFERDLLLPSGEIRNAIATYYPDIENGV